MTARGTKDRAIDFVCADPRGVDAIFLHNADKRALAAAGEQELSKVRQHEQRMTDQGLGLLNFEVVPFAFESSGAWGITGQLVWKELKVKLKAQKELLKDYQTGQHARTWSAFTPYQWFPTVCFLCSGKALGSFGFGWNQGLGGTWESSSLGSGRSIFATDITCVLLLRSLCVSKFSRVSLRTRTESQKICSLFVPK